MDVTNNYSDESQVAITLASIAYTFSGSSASKVHDGIQNCIAAKQGHEGMAALPTKGEWGIVWGPMISPEQDMSFIARKGLTETYAFVIRGTAKDPRSAIQNFKLKQVTPADKSWDWPNFPDGAKLSEGSCEGAHKVLFNTTDYTGSKGAYDYLNEHKPKELIVTGHSQGGTDTTVAAAYLKEALSGTTVKSYPFASLSAGNDVYANYYNQLFPDSTRFYNQYDLAWRFWERDLVKGIDDLYPSPGPKITNTEKGILQFGIAIGDPESYAYTQPTGTELSAKLYDSRSDSKTVTFLNEMGYQHDHLYYMYLMGIDVNGFQQLAANRYGVFEGLWTMPPTYTVNESASSASKSSFWKALINWLKQLIFGKK